MRRATKSLTTLSSLTQKLLPPPPPQTINNCPILSPLFLSTTGNDHVPTPTRPKKDSLILEKFRQRKLQGSSKPTTQTQQHAHHSTPNSSAVETKTKCENDGPTTPTQVVSSFEELGLKEELIGAAGEMGVSFPTEIQCVGIPPVLEGKTVLLSSQSGSGRTLAYLLPVLQLLRQDEALSTMKPNHPRAIVLCTTEELCDEGFCVAKFISDFALLKAAKESGAAPLHPEEVSRAQIGMLIGTPTEVLKQMEGGSVLTDGVKYLVLDEVDAMLDLGFGPEITKITKPLKNRTHQGCQTVLVTSTMTKVLGKEFSSIMERFEHDNAGKVTAMVLEMDQKEVFDFIESPNALKKKVAEAMECLH